MAMGKVPQKCTSSKESITDRKLYFQYRVITANVLKVKYKVPRKGSLSTDQVHHDSRVLTWNSMCAHRSDGRGGLPSTCHKLGLISFLYSHWRKDGTPIFYTVRGSLGT